MTVSYCAFHLLRLEHTDATSPIPAPPVYICNSPPASVCTSVCTSAFYPDMYAATTSNKRKRPSSEQVVPGVANDARLLASSGEAAGTARRRLSTASSSSRRAPVSAAAVSGNPFDDLDYPIPNFRPVYARMRDPGDGLKLADRRWRFLTYPKCFVGSEAVQWMVDGLECDRTAAVAMGQRLMDAGIIHHVTNSEPFADDALYYRFQEDDDTNILNMKRVWDASIPTRPAVDVAKDIITRLALLCEEHRKHILAIAPESPIFTQQEQQIQQAAKKHPKAPFSPLLSLMIPGSVSPPLLASSTPNLSLAPGTTSPLLSMGNAGAEGRAGSVAKLSHLSDDVDYSTLARSERFRNYVVAAAELQRVQLIGLNHDERLSFFVNVYNALCLHAHVSHGPPTNILRRITFFRALSYRVAGLDLTLDDIEHGILRGNKRAPMIKILQQLRPADPKCQHVMTERDGRIHFVISAGTRSDPPIRILDGDNVQEELHEATLDFLSCTVKVEVERRLVTLPRIMYWYAEDFSTPEDKLLLWVARYLPPGTAAQVVELVNTKSEGAVTIAYENFDWGNAEARFDASVVRRKRRLLERERSAGRLVDGVLVQQVGAVWPIGARETDGRNVEEHIANGLAPIISPEPREADGAASLLGFGARVEGQGDPLG